MKITLRDETDVANRYVTINGVLTVTARKEQSRRLVVELVPGEDGVPERMDYYDSGKHFVPERFSISWYRKDGGDWETGTFELKGQGFAKDGKTALKGRTRRSDGTLGLRWPLAADDHLRPTPEWIQEAWIQNLWAPYIPALGWPQAVTEETK